MNQPPTPIRVVVVDDHPVVRDGLVGMFGSEPAIEVIGEAGSGPEALIVIRAEDPDVVLMDLRMAGGGGVEAIAALRSGGRTRPRVLVLTTYNSERDIRTALEAGADGYLLKDARRAELVRAVQDLAVGRPVLTAEALAILAGRSTEQQLSERELDALRLIASGLTNRSVAARMSVSEATVKTHLTHAFDKLGVGDRAAAVRVAYERGLL
ncbi:response regulator transcription factor [Naumannella sp. ID2617S]|nr:response regulator transcription factor [Naumannella sp. ID2617S]